MNEERAAKGRALLERLTNNPGAIDRFPERFRDFTPGTFVYQDSGMFERLGVQRIKAPASAGEHYLKRMGFRDAGGTWIREVAPSGPPAQ